MNATEGSLGPRYKEALETVVIFVKTADMDKCVQAMPIIKIILIKKVFKNAFLIKNICYNRVIKTYML